MKERERERERERKKVREREREQEKVRDNIRVSCVGNSQQINREWCASSSAPRDQTK